MRARYGVLTVASLVLAGQLASAQGLTVAAASDLQSALPAIASQFEKDSGQKVTLTFGSSGNFFAQIQNGAPFDVFLSADINYPRRLEALGGAEPGSLYQTPLVVSCSGRETTLESTRGGLAVLVDARVRRVAVANPVHAPHGRAAVAALRHEQLYGAHDRSLSWARIFRRRRNSPSRAVPTSVSLALALALSPALKNSGTYVDIPASWYSPIEQAAVILASSRQKALARQFIDYLKTPASVRTLQAFGFAVSPATVR
jgi:molybdate transport system substrate-binding protein